MSYYYESDPLFDSLLLEQGLKLPIPDESRIKREALEKKGWQEWLMTLFPFWFAEDFSKEHEQFWGTFWDVLMKIKRKEEVDNRDATLILILGRGLGKCLDGDTDVTMADGTRRKIRDLRPGDRIVSYNEASRRFEQDTVKFKWATGHKNCVTIRTASRKSVTLTSDHRILTINGWKTAGEISLGDRIASPRNVPVFKTDDTHTDEEVRLLAYFLAEGCTTASKSRPNQINCRITSADDAVINDVIHCAERLGFKAQKGTRLSIDISGGSRRWVRANGLAGKKATQKRIPEWVFHLPTQQKWQFISAFIDTDGWIGVNGKIGITLANEQMVLDIQSLLLQMGVPSSIFFRENDHANAWEVLFDQEGVIQNRNKFTLRLKGDKLEDFLSTRRYSLIDTYPYQEMRGLPYGVGYMVQRAGLSISHKYDCTRQKMRDAIAIYPHERWLQLEDSDVFWDKVVAIDDAGEKETFDVEIAQNHNLITNHLITHNSACVEAARIMRGAILNGGYSLIISETDDQAQEHLGNCRILIEHPDSRLLEYYPDMKIAESSDLMKGMPTADRKEMFVCRNGYVLRAKGLAAKMRGLRVGVQRPNDFCGDDLDDVNDSLTVSANKLRLITASIIPVLARENVTIHIGQNLISEHSVVSQIYRGTTDALAERTIIGPAAAFEKLDIESEPDETGKVRHKILPSSQPSWKGLSVERAQKFLDNSGLATFMAEYQNKFDQFHSGRVIAEYNERAQLITWSQFEQVFGERRIPSHWRCLAGVDVGYSEGRYPHYSAWAFLATAARNSKLPGAVFLYRGRAFAGTSIDDQIQTILSEMYHDERDMIASWQISHERTGEMMTLQQKYKLPFGKIRYYKAEDGVAQWRHMSRPDYTKPNPFKYDEKADNELYTIGRPMIYYIVDDDQILRSRDDNGLHIFRRQVANWEYVPVKLTDTGQTVQKPSKVDDDFCDITKSLLAYFGAGIADLTPEEKILAEMPERFKKEDLTEREKMAQNLWLQKKANEAHQKQLLKHQGNPMGPLARRDPISKMLAGDS